MWAVERKRATYIYIYLLRRNPPLDPPLIVVGGGWQVDVLVGGLEEGRKRASSSGTEQDV